MSELVTKASVGGVDVVRLHDELTIAVKTQLRSALIQLAVEGARLVLDMSRVTFVDSSALGVLIELDHLVGSRNGLYVIAALRSDVERVFRLAGMQRLVRIFPTTDAAAEFVESLPAIPPPH